MNRQRIEHCANFLQETLEIETDEFPGADGDMLDAMIEETARTAGYSEAEIAAAWALINEQEGA